MIAAKSGFNQFGLVVLIHAIHGKDGLGEVYTNRE